MKYYGVIQPLTKTKKPPDLGGFNILNSENYSNNVNGLSKYVLNVSKN